MARPTYVVEELIAALKAVNAPDALVATVRQRLVDVGATRVTAARKSGDSSFVVASGYGHATRRGFVTLEVDGHRWQMAPNDAQQIAVMLFEAAAAAISDEVVMTFFRDDLGEQDPVRIGALLLRLRELRQGSRDAVFPS